MTIFDKKLRKQSADTALGRLVANIGSLVHDSMVGQSGLTQMAVSTESLSDNDVRMFESAVDGLRTNLTALSARMNTSLESYQIDAGVVGGLVSLDPKAMLGNKQSLMISAENMQVVGMPAGEGFDARPLSLEAYDDRDNKNAALYTIAYNMQSSRQDDFCETLFPTIVLSPDQVGITITVRLMQVFNELYRQISGALDNYNKKNIIRAVADPTILKNEMTRIIPVYRPESAANFVASAKLAPRTIDLEGEAISTSSLAVGKKFSLLGISQTDHLLESGVMDITDSIEQGIRLKYVVIEVGNDVLKFDVSNLPTSEFTYATQGNFRKMQLNFESSSVLINADTKNAAGGALDTLAPVVSGDYIVRLDVGASGSVNLELGDTEVFGNKATVFSVQNSTGELLSLSSAPGSTIAALFANAKVIGYELVAYRSNLNRRQRGQLIDTTFFTQAYNVYFTNPITAIHPVTMDGQTDASDLQALVTATRIRTSNAGVKALIEAAQTLREFVDARDYQGVPPDVLGVGRFYVLPSYFEETIDMTQIINSLTSFERAQDMQAALVNKIRDYAFRMYRDSQYKAAADALAGGLAPVPNVIIATDPVLARYLTVAGDLRTLGGEFNCRVVSSLDVRVAGKIFITFGVFDETRNTQPNPLNFGNMLWSPEVTVVLPIARNGQISKELAVAPRFRHIVNTPILTVLTVNNVPDVVGKVSIDFHSV